MEANAAYKLEQPVVLPSLYSKGRRDALASALEKDVSDVFAPPLRDISQSFARGLTDALYSAAGEEKYPSRKESLEYFEKGFMQREIKRVKGNLTQYVRDAFEVEDPAEINNRRRNVYRQIEKYGLNDFVDSARPWKPAKLDTSIDAKLYVAPEKVESALSGALSHYKSILNDDTYNALSDSVKEKSPLLAERLSPYLPSPSRRLEEVMGATAGVKSYAAAKDIFERQVIYDALDAAGFDKKRAAEYLGDSLRTLNRRISELGIEASQQTEAKPQPQTMEQHVEDKQPRPAPAAATDNVTRFRALVEAYNANRDAARKKKSNIPAKDTGLRIVI